MSKVLVAMSGGVDSSVAALLLKNEGNQLLGVTMKLYDNEDIGIRREKTCCSLSDVEDARHVAAMLGFPYYVFNFSDEFEKEVMQPFVADYERGFTPNPCIVCNRFLKFDALLRRGLELGCDAIATGHYARVFYDELSGRYLLAKAVDETKDQTYMLYSLTQEQLSRVRFPLGNYDKPAIRRMAEENGLITARKRDSQDICFVQTGSYADFIEKYTGKTYPPGNFVDKDGHVLGRHKGIIHYTLGQRKGLGLALPASMYVIRLDLVRNEVVLGFNEDLMHRTMTVKNINLVPTSRLAEEGVRALVKTRYSQKASYATLWQTGDDEIKVLFDEPQRAITPGQAAVFYFDQLVKPTGLVTVTGLYKPAGVVEPTGLVKSTGEEAGTQSGEEAHMETIVLGGGTIVKSEE